MHCIKRKSDQAKLALLDLRSLYMLLVFLCLVNLKHFRYHLHLQ